MDSVLVHPVNNARVVVLNRPKALNALSLDMVRRLKADLERFEEEKDVRMVIVKGAGDKAFCAGGDVVGELAKLQLYPLAAVRKSALDDTDLYRDFFADEYRLNHLIGTYSLPYVALLNGITMGGGVGMSMHGRYRVATDSTLFAMPEMAIGS